MTFQILQFKKHEGHSSAFVFVGLHVDQDVKLHKQHRTKVYKSRKNLVSKMRKAQ